MGYFHNKLSLTSLTLVEEHFTFFQNALFTLSDGIKQHEQSTIIYVASPRGVAISHHFNSEGDRNVV